MKTVLKLVVLALCAFASAFAQSPVNSGQVGSPVQGVGGSSSSQGINPKDAAYGAKGDAQLSTGALGVGQGTGNCPNGVPSGVCIKLTSNALLPTDVGKVVFGVVSASGASRLNPGGIITQVFAADTFTTNNIAGFGGCGGGCAIVWGTDDTAALLAANTAASGSSGTSPEAINGGSLTITKPASQTVYVPPGGYIISSRPFNCGNGQSVIGGGMDKTVFYMTPDFSAAGVADNTGLVVNNCGHETGNFTLSGVGFNATFNLKYYISFGGSLINVSNIKVLNAGSASGKVLVFTNASGVASNINVLNPPIGSGTILCSFQAVNMDVYDIFCSNGPENLNVNGITGAGSSQRLAFHGGLIDECSGGIGTGTCTDVLTSKDVYFIGTTLLGNGGTFGLQVDATSEVRISSGNIGPFGGNNGSALNIVAGGKVWATETEIRCPTGTCLTNAGTFFDLGGNTWSFAGGTQFAGANAPLAALTHSTWNGFVSTLTATSTFAQFTVDQPITMTRIQSAVITAPVTCSPNAVITVTDGTSPVTLTITAATNDSGVIAQAYPSGAVLQFKITTAAAGCGTSPVNLNVNMLWQARGTP